MPWRQSSILTRPRALDGARNSGTNVDWITWAKDAGIYIAPLLMGGMFWQEVERKRLIADNKALNSQVYDLAERVLTISAELKTYLFNERKT